MYAHFADGNDHQVLAYGGRRDPAIWTWAYLAPRALRLMEARSGDAEIPIAEKVGVIHRWWGISGDPAVDSTPAIIQDLTDRGVGLVRFRCSPKLLTR
jgi:hypothetical protein